nr:MAG TPA: hypothetical protein [Caudoviricetes sp.]
MFELVVAMEFGNGKIIFSNDDRRIYDIDAIDSFIETLGYRLYNNDKFIVLYHERNDIKCIKILKGVKLK